MPESPLPQQSSSARADVPISAGELRPAWLFFLFRKGLEPATWITWTVFALILAILNGINPEKRSVSFPVYRAACAAWWNGREMYDDYYNGFIYLPHAALMYTPFYLLPARIGEPLYRVLVIGLLAWAVWKITLLTRARAWNENFLVVSLIVIGVAAGSAVNGQYNLPLTATLLFATCALIEKKWWPACIWLVISILLKPIAVAPVLLAFALYPALWWRMPLVGVVALFIPFLCSISNLGYAAAEYKTFWDTAIRAILPLERRFAEFSTILFWCGLDLNDGERKIARVGAALLTLALSFIALRRHGPLRGGLLVWALGVTYLMIFNPRTEGVTYVIVSPALALFGAFDFAQDGKPMWRRAVGLTLLVFGVLMIVAHELMPHGGEYQRIAQGSKDLLVRPTMSVLFYFWLSWLTIADRPDGARGLPGVDGSISMSSIKPL